MNIKKGIIAICFGIFISSFSYCPKGNAADAVPPRIGAETSGIQDPPQPPPLPPETGDVCTTFTPDMINKLQTCKMSQDSLDVLQKACNKDTNFLRELGTPEGAQKYQDAMDEYNKAQPCVTLLTKK